MGSPPAVDPRHRNLLIVDLDGGESTVEIPPQAFRSPRWSPDGQRLAFVGPGPSEEEDQIYVYDVATGALPNRRVSGGGLCNLPIHRHPTLRDDAMR